MTDFTRSAREIELEQRTQEFIRDVVIPYEQHPQLQHGLDDALVRELRQKAAAVGLLSPQVGEEWGGHGLNPIH